MAQIIQELKKKVYLLRENVVKEQLRDRNDDFIARACYLDYGQDFGAGGGDIDDYSSAVRGVRKPDPIMDAYTL